MKRFVSFFASLLLLLSVSFADRSKITILYTNDIHTHIDNMVKDSSGKKVPGLSYSSVSAVKKDLSDSGEKVILVDDGDFAQGTIFGVEDQGKTIVQLMNAAGYDVATLGNHEFDYGMDVLEKNIRKAKFNIVACNFHRQNKLVTKPYVIVRRGNVKVCFIGIATPESLTKSSPVIFMDKAKKNIIYNFDEDSNGDKLASSVQKAIDEVKDKVDYVIALGHLGIDRSSEPYRSTDIISKVSGLDAFIDGHSHSVVEHMIVKDKDDRDVLLTQTGCYLSSIGKMTLDGDSVQTEFIRAYDRRDDKVEIMTKKFIDKTNAKMNEVFAFSDVKFVMRTDDNTDWFVRKHETNLGDFVSDCFYYYINEIEKMPCDIVFMNGGGIRENIPEGVFNTITAKTVQPFGNQVCIVKLDGQSILDVLEFGSRGAGKDSIGGFMQVAGVKYAIDSSAASTVKMDDKKRWTGRPSSYRVHDVQIYDRAEGKYMPLELNKIYHVGGINFILRNMGDGFTMFENAELIKDYIGEDFLLMCEYAKAFGGKDSKGSPHISTKNSPLKNYPGYLIDYENPDGSGRIIIK